MDMLELGRGLFALLFVLGLVGAFAIALKRYGVLTGMVSRGRLRRLSLQEVIALDTRRRLVLVRRDGVDHLLLLGPSGDLVVERGITPPPEARFVQALSETESRPGTN